MRIQRRRLPRVSDLPLPLPPLAHTGAHKQLHRRTAMADPSVVVATPRDAASHHLRRLSRRSPPYTQEGGEGNRPEIIIPRSPTIVWYPSGNEDTVSCIFARFDAARTSSAVALIRPYRMLCSIVLLNNGVSCGTTPILLLSDSIVTSLMSCPSTRMRPPCTS